MKILIIGIAGGLAQLTARLIKKDYPQAEIIGVDTRETKRLSKGHKDFECKTIRYSRGQFENLFREHSFDIVFHLGRISHSQVSNETVQHRLDLNVVGTNHILDSCLHYGVKRVVVLSTFHVYGALPDNPVFLPESSPLRASLRHPEVSDVVEMDQIATNFMWQYQNQCTTIVLRPCNIIGRQIKNTMGNYLTSSTLPAPSDYDPHFQFIHEFDMATVLASCVEKLPLGIYNVSTNEHLALSQALEITGVDKWTVPFSVGGAFVNLLRPLRSRLPLYLLDYLKFACLIDNSHLRKHLGENFWRFSINDSLSLLDLR
jgi:UDP-glucose 4-epimerase